MGIIIFPFLIGAIIIGYFSLQRIIMHIKNREIRFKEVLLGILISISIFGIICLSYIIEGQAWALSPPLRIPTFMVYVPYVIYLFIKNTKNKTIFFVAKSLLISIVFTTILGIIFNDQLFNILDFLKVAKHY